MTHSGLKLFMMPRHDQMSRTDDVMHIKIVGECQGYKPQLKYGCLYFIEYTT